jgi:hypothetical protein
MLTNLDINQEIQKYEREPLLLVIVRLDIIDWHHIQLSPLFKTQSSHKLLHVLGILTGFI